MSLACPGLECCIPLFTSCGIFTPIVVTSDMSLCVCVGSEISGTISASGGEPPYTFSLFSGSLPDGVTLNTTTGVISGTPTTGGNYTFVVRVTDANGSMEDISVTIQIPTITTESLPDYVVGEPYSFQLTSIGGSGSMYWAIASGSLPDGLTLSSDGLISGTPTELVEGQSVTFALQDLECPLDPLSSCGTFDACEMCVDAAMDGFMRGCGGLPPYIYTVTDGALPDGITLDSNTGQFSGTATTAGSFTFTIQISDSNSDSITVEFSVSVLQITTVTVLESFTIGVPYSLQLEAIGGSGSYVWSIQSGNLPDGLTLSESGLISGTPTSEGNTIAVFSVSDVNCGETPPAGDMLVDYDGNPISDYDGNIVGTY